MGLVALGKKAQKINITQLALNIVKSNSGLIDNKIRGQLQVGESGSGGSVGTYTTPRYAGFKKRIGSLAPFGTVDLKLSGRLHKGLKTAISLNSYKTDSSVSYSKYQIDRYGKKIYELQKENQKDISFKNSFDTVRKYKSLLGL